MSTYNIVGQTYYIVSHHKNISILYVQKYVQCRTSGTYDIVRAYCTISYVHIYVRYRMLTYDIVRQLSRRMLVTVTTSYVNIWCRMLDLRHRVSVLAPWIDFKISKDPRPRGGHMACVFVTTCTPFYASLPVPTGEKHGKFLHKKWLLSRANFMASGPMNYADSLHRCQWALL